jgi:hypothetical protein
MAREIIKLSLSAPFRPEPAAIFFSTLAYPKADDANVRDQFRSALCRWAILTQCEMDGEWANAPQLVRPDIFIEGDREWHEAYKRGMRELDRRLFAADHIAMPHYLAWCGLLRSVEGYQVTVENMSHLAMDFLRWTGDSVSTLKSRIWGPSRPVIHAALALKMWCVESKEVLESIGGHRALLPLLIAPKALEGILAKSEFLRKCLPFIPQFRIKEEDTVQFLAE